MRYVSHLLVPASKYPDGHQIYFKNAHLDHFRSAQTNLLTRYLEGQVLQVSIPIASLESMYQLGRYARYARYACHSHLVLSALNRLNLGLNLKFSQILPLPIPFPCLPRPRPRPRGQHGPVFRDLEYMIVQVWWVWVLGSEDGVWRASFFF